MGNEITYDNASSAELISPKEATDRSAGYSGR